MNCKPGDLAVIVRSKAGNEGRIVEVLTMLGEHPEYKGLRWCKGAGPVWLVRSQGSALRSRSGVRMQMLPVPDARLRPIRPKDGEDEILRIAGKPEGAREAKKNALRAYVRRLPGKEAA